MLSIEKMIQSAESCLGWPYVSPGTNDSKGIDCSGLFVKIYKDQGAKIAHGSNSIFRKYCSETGKLSNIAQLQPGMAVFKFKEWTANDKSNSWYGSDPGNLSHIGIVTSIKPLNIIHASTVGMKVKTDTSLGKWAYWGKLKDVDYSNTDKKEVTIVVEYAKVTGGGLNMRAAKFVTADKITQIPNGATVAVVEHNDNWCKVTYNNYTGYVMTTYLSFDNSESGAEKTSKVMISLLEDCALALYEALKYSLKK